MSLLLALPTVRHGITRFVQRFLQPSMQRSPGKISESDWISTESLSSLSNAAVACRVLHLYRAATPVREGAERLASSPVARRQRLSSGLAPSREISSNGKSTAVKQPLT